MHPSLLIDVAEAQAVDVQYMSKSPLYLHDGNPYEGMLYSALEGVVQSPEANTLKGRVERTLVRIAITEV